MDGTPRVIVSDHDTKLGSRFAAGRRKFCPASGAQYCVWSRAIAGSPTSACRIPFLFCRRCGRRCAAREDWLDAGRKARAGVPLTSLPTQSATELLEGDGRRPPAPVAPHLEDQRQLHVQQVADRAPALNLRPRPRANTEASVTCVAARRTATKSFRSGSEMRMVFKMRMCGSCPSVQSV